MRISSVLIFIVFNSFSFLVEAEITCPWAKLKGQDLLQFSYSDDINNELTVIQVQEDLACLKVLIENKYVGQDRHPEISLVDRLTNLSNEAFSMKSSQLLNLIYNLHQGIPDVHLSYQVNGEEKRFSGVDKKDVTLSENLNSDTLYDRDNFIYFKPSEILMPELTESQKLLIEIIKSGDRNLVIDLRETYGGGGIFPELLAQSIFAKEQKIPQTTTKQIVSGLSYIGLAISAWIDYGDQVKDFFDYVKSSFKDKSFNELISFKIDEKITARVGQRSNAYKSKIYLLIDGSCASECETIVELISAHPNATLIGQNTAGALHFSNAISFTLPNSGIWVRLPSLSHIYENDALEGVGYVPAIRTDFIDLNKLAF